MAVVHPVSITVEPYIFLHPVLLPRGQTTWPCSKHSYRQSEGFSRLLSTWPCAKKPSLPYAWKRKRFTIDARIQLYRLMVCGWSHLRLGALYNQRWWAEAFPISKIFSTLARVLFAQNLVLYCHSLAYTWRSHSWVACLQGARVEVEFCGCTNFAKLCQEVINV